MTNEKELAAFLIAACFTERSFDKATKMAEGSKDSTTATTANTAFGKPSELVVKASALKLEP